jgi:PAT family acetyl-CoA transporter-like MFS transporter 1
MAFYARVAHANVALGGTYMTLLNTLSNLGVKIWSTISLAVVDSLSVKTCRAAGDAADTVGLGYV